MKFKILTIFPEVISNFLNFSILKKAIDKKIISVEIYDFRNWSENKHRKVDDYSYGGDGGMVLMCQPIISCLKEITEEEDYTILLTPQGKRLEQKKVKTLGTKSGIILICGHYEGFDERIREYVDEEVSTGDYILTGGELPAAIVCDSVSRTISGVINDQSLKNESFDNNLLDFPVYTKPRVFEGKHVPEVLLNGNHAEIKKWREAKRKEKSKKLLNK